MSSEEMSRTEKQEVAVLTPRQQQIVELLRTGNTRKSSAEMAGIHRDTFYRWLEVYTAFAEAVRQAEAQAEVEAVFALRRLATGGYLVRRRTITHRDGATEVIDEFGPPQTGALTFWLERRRRGWRQAEPLDVKKLTDDQLLNVLAAIDEMEAEQGCHDDLNDAG